MAGIKLPKEYHGDGEDRSKTLTGTVSKRNTEMYWEYVRNNIAFTYPQGRDKSPNLAIRAGQYKLLMNHDGSDAQLYDIDKDPNETTNVIADQPKVAQQLKEKLSKWWASLPKLP